MALTVKVVYLVGLAVQGLGLILHIVGLATPEWSVGEGQGNQYSYSLWEQCTTDDGAKSCFYYTSAFKEAHPPLPAAAAFAIIGLIVGTVAVVIGLLYVIFPAIGKTARPDFPTASCIIAFSAFIFVIISVICYRAGFHAKFTCDCDIGYSFGLSITGGILMLIGGLLVSLGKTYTTE